MRTISTGCAKPEISRDPIGSAAAPGGTAPASSAQARREVHRAADVVVALEQDDVAAGEAGAQREGDVELLDPPLQREDATDEPRALRAHEHGAVAEPLRHSDAVVGARL